MGCGGVEATFSGGELGGWGGGGGGGGLGLCSVVSRGWGGGWGDMGLGGGVHAPKDGWSWGGRKRKHFEKIGLWTRGSSKVGGRHLLSKNFFCVWGGGVEKLGGGGVCSFWFVQGNGLGGGAFFLQTKGRVLLKEHCKGSGYGFLLVWGFEEGVFLFYLLGVGFSGGGGMGLGQVLGVVSFLWGWAVLGGGWVFLKIFGWVVVCVGVGVLESPFGGG